MRFVAFSDWRVQSFEPLLEWMKSAEADYVVYAGDDTIRMADLPREGLRLLLRNRTKYDVPDTSEDEQIILDQTTLTRFVRKVKKREHDLVFSSRNRILSGSVWPLQTQVSRERSRPVWFGPRPPKSGPCLYYRRFSPSWIDRIAATTVNGLGAIVGNDCEFHDHLRFMRKRVADLHRHPRVIDGVAFLGLEGSPGDIGVVLYEEEDAYTHLTQQWDAISELDPKYTVLVTHAPPKGILDLSMRFGVNNIGSESVKRFVLERDIGLVVCGHSHINGGKVTRLGGCTVLNIASHDYQDAAGLVALVGLDVHRQPKIQIERLWDQDSTLRLIHGIGEVRLQNLRHLGITGLENVSEKNRRKMLGLSGVSASMVNRWILEAKSLRDGTACRICDDAWRELRPQRVLVYDVETNIEQSKVWCIGVWNGREKEFVQFFETRNERRLLDSLFEYVNNSPNLVPVSFSATGFDQRMLCQSAKRYRLEVPSCFEHEIDLGSLVVHRTIGMPKGGLKQVAPFFSYEWADPSIDGMFVGMEYSRFLQDGSEPDWDKLLEYNKDDVMATLQVLTSLLNLEEVTAE